MTRLILKSKINGTTTATTTTTYYIYLYLASIYRINHLQMIPSLELHIFMRLSLYNVCPTVIIYNVFPYLYCISTYLFRTYLSSRLISSYYYDFVFLLRYQIRFDLLTVVSLSLYSTLLYSTYITLSLSLSLCSKKSFVMILFSFCYLAILYHFFYVRIFDHHNSNYYHHCCAIHHLLFSYLQMRLQLQQLQQEVAFPVV